MPMASRFAPSPTGRLHLGHAYSALMAQDAARGGDGVLHVRIDDLDEGRVRAEFRAGIEEDLLWLGVVPDAPPLLQSTRHVAYAAALAQLRADGLVYPCFCSRAAVLAEVADSIAAPHTLATRPHGGTAAAANAVYPGTCRRLSVDAAQARIEGGAAHAWRITMAEAVRRTGPLSWHSAQHDRTDAVPGVFTRVAADPGGAGDVVLARRDGTPAYHLASTIDDAHLAISHVVRGDDLFAATHIHRLLQALLGLPSPVYTHHRLVGDRDGRRLAKRDDAASIASLRDAGVDPVKLCADLRRGALPPGYRWTSAVIRD